MIEYYYYTTIIYATNFSNEQLKELTTLLQEAGCTVSTPTSPDVINTDALPELACELFYKVQGINFMESDPAVILN